MFVERNLLLRYGLESQNASVCTLFQPQQRRSSIDLLVMVYEDFVQNKALFPASVLLVDLNGHHFLVRIPR